MNIRRHFRRWFYIGSAQTPAGRALLNTGAVSYHVLGDVTVGSPVGNFTVPYSTNGRFTATGVAR